MLYNAGDIIGISVLDHIIIGKQGYVSMKEKGILI
jgi:DNA repair protein RadC